MVKGLKQQCVVWCGVVCRSAEFVIAFNKGIDASGNLLEACLALGVVQAKVSEVCAMNTVW